jgi:GTPase SAR1 family protein
MNFKKEVEKKLQSLSIDQIVDFAYRCSVRALPFLADSAAEDFWKSNNVQQNLAALFRTLDFIQSNNIELEPGNKIVLQVALLLTKESIPVFPRTTVIKSITYAGSAKLASLSYNRFISDTSEDIDWSNDWDVMRGNHLHNTAGERASRVEKDRKNAISAAAASAEVTLNASIDGNHEIIDFKEIILADLQLSKQLPAPEIYGSMWLDFQKVLEKNGCGYWAKLYTKIFDKNFKVTRRDLNKRLNLAVEIREQGASAISNYLENLDKAKPKLLNEARIIILGEKGAGKTSLARRLKNPRARMALENESTQGVDIFEWKISNKQQDINTNIWDFAGHTITHAVHKFFLAERCLYILVYDGRTETRNRLNYWLDQIKNFGGDSPVFIFNNLRDKNNVEIPINDLKKNYPIVGLHSFSLKDEIDALKKFRQTLAEFIKTHSIWSKQEIPLNYYKVKTDLKKLFNQSQSKIGKERINKAEFEVISQKYDVDDKDQLLKDLHSLGIILWYQDIQTFDSIILNPEWVSSGIYDIEVV